MAHFFKKDTKFQKECFSFRQLRGVRLPDSVGSQDDAVPGAGLLAQLHVRRRVLGLIPHQAGSRPWSHGSARHSLPRPHQHFQQCQVSRTFRSTQVHIATYSLWTS